MKSNREYNIYNVSIVIKKDNDARMFNINSFSTQKEQELCFEECKRNNPHTTFYKSTEILEG